MAVYKRAYRSYTGPITDERRRFLVLTRYSVSQLFSSRAFSWFMMVTLLPVLISAAFIYVTNSVTATSPRTALTGPSARSAACRASTAQVNRSGSG